MLFLISFIATSIGIFLSPVWRISRALLGLLLFVASAYLLVGIGVRTALYIQYRSVLDAQNQQWMNLKTEKTVLKKIYAIHPTATVLLLDLAQIEYRVGNKNQAQQYLAVLERIDPNNPSVETLQKNLEN